MIDPRIAKLAEVLVHYSTEVREGDRVCLRGGPLSSPLMCAVYGEVVKAGGHPLPLLSVDGTKRLLFEHGSEEQLAYAHQPIKDIFATYDVFITIDAAPNIQSGAAFTPEKVAVNQRSSKDLFQLIMGRYERGEIRWLETLFPTNAYAQEAGMSLWDYEQFVYGACLPDWDDPVAYWKRTAVKQQQAVDWLQGKREIRVEGPDVDLTLRIDGRPFVNCDGKGNMPDGEIYTCPLEESVEGHVRFSYPSVFGGRKVEGIELEFRKGRVVRAKADRGDAFLQSTLKRDEGARCVGEFALGMNQGIVKPTGNILYDEKIGGSFHIALGASAPDAGGTIESSIHWDLVSDLRDGGRITADGELFYENGKLLMVE